MAKIDVTLTADGSWVLVHPEQDDRRNKWIDPDEVAAIRAAVSRGHPPHGDGEDTPDYVLGYNKGYEDAESENPGLGFEVGFHAGQAAMLEDAQECPVEVTASGHPLARACFYIVGPVVRSYTRLNWREARHE